jgi:hypothetical protein
MYLFFVLNYIYIIYIKKKNKYITKEIQISLLGL